VCVLGPWNRLAVMRYSRFLSSDQIRWDGQIRKIAGGKRTGSDDVSARAAHAGFR
jgi:hypothetical protein